MVRVTVYFLPAKEAEGAQVTVTSELVGTLILFLSDSGLILSLPLTVALKVIPPASSAWGTSWVRKLAAPTNKKAATIVRAKVVIWRFKRGVACLAISSSITEPPSDASAA